MFNSIKWLKNLLEHIIHGTMIIKIKIHTHAQEVKPLAASLHLKSKNISNNKSNTYTTIKKYI